MDKYFVFRKMMDFVADHAEVVDADMNWCGDAINIVGQNDEQVIEITVAIRKKEDQNNGN